MSKQDDLLLAEIANEIMPMTKTEAYRGWQIRTAERVLAKVKQNYEQKIGEALKDFSDIQREEGHPKSYWAGYHYARSLVMSALKGESNGTEDAG